MTTGPKSSTALRPVRAIPFPEPDLGAIMNPRKRIYPAIIIGAIILWLVLVPLGINYCIDLRQERNDNLLSAARSGRAQEVAALLAAGADPNARETPLDMDSSRSLWEHIVDVLTHAPTPGVMYSQSLGVAWARTALGCACENGHAVDVVRLLLEKGADLKADEAGQQPALPIAAKKGDVATVRVLLEHGADINSRDDMRLSVLQNAVESDNPELVRLLLDKGAKVEGSNPGPTRPSYKNYETIRQMIENAAKK
jgi:ankyrin repeat protein